MNAFDSQIGQYNVTVRLFNFINGLPQDKQYILYKQLIKGNVKTELFKLIIDLPEDEKIQLLERLGEVPFEEESIKTINLDENESFMRENTRKVCQIPVKCKVEDRSFKSYIVDISTVGALIESNDSFPVGQKILMALSLPNQPKALELTGRIVRSGVVPRGLRSNIKILSEFTKNLSVNLLKIINKLLFFACPFDSADLFWWKGLQLHRLSHLCGDPVYFFVDLLFSSCSECRPGFSCE
jgi:Tfp pilus assembly protein PilZ